MLAALALLVLGASHEAPTIERSPWSVRAVIVRVDAQDDRVEPSATAPRIEAASAFANGEAAYQRGEYDRASAYFARAYELVPHPATLYNLGMAQVRSGDAVAAWTTFDRLAREASTEGDRRDAVTARERVRPSIALLHLQAAPGDSVCLDGERIAIDRSPRVVAIPPGSHQLRFGESATRLDLSAGETQTIDLEAHAAVERMRRPSRAMVPLLTTTAIGAGVATGLGLAAITVPRARTELAAGAAAASGVALGTAVAALIVRARTRPGRQRRAPKAITTDCSGH